MAKSLRISRPHGTTADAALEKLRGLARQIEDQYGLTVKWKGDVAQVSGRGVKKGSTASVDGSTVTLDLSLGMPASLVAGKIEEGIEKAIAKHFG